MNLPNLITIFRLFLVPVIIASILQENYGSALWLFLVAGISDALDGFIARRFDMRTQLGATLDPLADKILIVATVLALFRLQLLPLWLTIVIVCRDIVIAGGAIAWHVTSGRIEMAPSITSKLNTFFQISMIFLVLGQSAGLVRITSWLPLILILVFLTSLVSGIQYVLVWGKKAWDRSRLLNDRK